MGLFNRKPKVQPLVCDNQRIYTVEVRGTPHYTDAIAPLVHRQVSDFRSQDALEWFVSLVSDPTITYVPNAVRVDLDGKRVGHLPADATEIGHILLARAAGAAVLVRVDIQWQRKAGPFYLMLSLPPTKQLAAAIPLVPLDEYKAQTQ